MENQNIQSVTQNVTKKGNTLIPLLIMIISSLIMLAAFFLPYASATKDYKASLERYSDEPFIEKIGINNDDVIHISLVEYARIYGYTASEGDSGVAEVSIVCLVVIAVCGVFTIMTLLFSILRKTIPVIVFDILAFCSFCLLAWDYSSRGVMPGRNYNCGISYYIFYICTVLILAGAIWRLVAMKKAAKQQTITVSSNIG